MMQFNQDHHSMVNINKEIKYHGKNIKNGYKIKDMANFGENLKKIIRAYVKIYYRVLKINLKKVIQNIINNNIILNIYYLLRVSHKINHHVLPMMYKI